MPALPPAPLTLLVINQLTYSTDPDVITRFHFKYTGSAPTNTDMTTVASGAFTAWSNRFTTNMHPNVSLILTRVVDLSSPSGAQGQHTGANPGTATGGPLPANTAVLVNHTIQRRYRGGKPRNFLPLGVDTDLQDSQHWKAGSVSSFQGSFDSYVGQVSGLTWAGGTISGLVNVSYYQGFTPATDPVTGRTRDIPKLRSGGPVIDAITASKVNTFVGTQRRRIRGTGN